jgi:hypothetical protein
MKSEELPREVTLTTPRPWTVNGKKISILELRILKRTPNPVIDRYMMPFRPSDAY